MFAYRVIFDIAVISILSYMGLYMDLYWQPVKRGFNCGDVSINYRKQDDTVTPNDCRFGSIFLPTIIILFFDIAVYRRRSREIYQNCMVFHLGMSLVFFTCNFIKYNVGMLRPYFLSICKPDYNKLDCTHGYVSDAMCTGDESDIKWARLTFPSLHSSVTSYSLTFLFIFLFHRYNKSGYIMHASIAVIQCFYITWYIFVTLTRVLDHRHHVTDVVAGSVWGIVFALLMTTQCTELFTKRPVVADRVELSPEVPPRDKQD